MCNSGTQLLASKLTQLLSRLFVVRQRDVMVHRTVAIFLSQAKNAMHVYVKGLQ